jgi:hypothetical protein
MKFLVDVRWHIRKNDEVIESRWMVWGLSGNGTQLILEEVSGLRVVIPLDLIEFIRVQRRG